MMAKITERTNRNLRLARLERGFTQEGMAEAAGVSRSAYNEWEREGKLPSIKMAVKVANALGVNYKRIFDYGEKF